MTRHVMAVIYCRTACITQVGEDNPLLAQEEACRAYASENGIEISGVFRDPGVSGMSADRPGWHAMMQALKNASAPHGILIRDISRLARDFALSDEMEAACNRLGHTIIAVDENADARYEPIPPGMLQNVIRILKKHEDNHL